MLIMMGVNGHLEAFCLQHGGQSQLLRWGMQGKWTHIFIFYLKTTGTSLGVQWLRLCTSIAGGVDLISGRRTRNPHAAQCGQKINWTKQTEKNSCPQFQRLTVLCCEIYLGWYSIALKSSMTGKSFFLRL